MHCRAALSRYLHYRRPSWQYIGLPLLGPEVQESEATLICTKVSYLHATTDRPGSARPGCAGSWLPARFGARFINLRVPVLLRRVAVRYVHSTLQLAGWDGMGWDVI
jgi:hypothetical protein